MNRLSLEADSLNESRGESNLIEKLRQDLAERQKIIQDKIKIIESLREQVADLTTDNENLEIKEQMLTQKVDRLQKELSEKNEELENLSRTQEELDKATTSLSKRLEGRTAQLQKYVEELKSVKTEITEVRRVNEELQSQNELLTTELQSSKRRIPRDRDQDDALSHEIHNLRTQIETLKAKNSSLVQEVEQKVRQLTDSELQQMEQIKAQCYKLQQQNERLVKELKSATKNSMSNSDQEIQTNEEMIRELYDLRAQVKSLSHRQSRRSIDEEILNLQKELEITETSWKLEKQHKERYAKENFQLERKVNELSKQLERMNEFNSKLESRYAQMEARYAAAQTLQSNGLHHQNIPAPELPPKEAAMDPAFRMPSSRSEPALPHDENKPDITAAIHFSMAEEVGEFMDSSTIPKSAAPPAKEKRALNQSNMWNQANEAVSNKRMNMENGMGPKPIASNDGTWADYRIKKSSFLEPDPIAEQKLRMDRANELARRNMQTKPLHQSSYALELDTFDASNLTETQIKRGNVPRPVLADLNNQRKPVRKAEAFIV